MKKLFSIALAAILAANMGTAAFAASVPTANEDGAASSVTVRDYTEAEEIAVKLKSLGLFKGVSDTDFDLDRAPTRTEAVVMLIRFLGKEAEVTKGTYSHPFSDVPEWADKYIGYAYENKLTNGISATEFGAVSDASAAMFLTFVLRALGYTDKENGDFLWDNPYELAEKTGILTDNVNIEQFYRADVAIVAYNSLEAELKGKEITLSDKLMEAGVFTAEDYAKVAPPRKYNYLTDFTDYSPSDGLTEDGYFEGVKLSDYVDLTEYDSFDMTKYLTVTDGELNRAVADCFPYFEFKYITDRAVIDGDRVNAAIEVYADGELIEDSASTEDIDIQKSYLSELTESLKMMISIYVGYGEDGSYGENEAFLENAIAYVTELANEFYDCMIGLKPGESAELKLTDFMDMVIELVQMMGEDIGEIEVYADKEIVCKLTVNHIYDLNIIPELTDEMVNAYGYDTVEELVAEEMEYLLEEKKVLGAIDAMGRIKVKEIPDAVAEYYINLMIYMYVSTSGADTLDEAIASIYGDVPEEYGDMIPADASEFVDTVILANVDETLEYIMLALAVAEHEGITLTDEDLASEEYTEMLEMGGDRFAKMVLLILKGIEHIGMEIY